MSLFDIKHPDDFETFQEEWEERKELLEEMAKETIVIRQRTLTELFRDLEWENEIQEWYERHPEISIEEVVLGDLNGFQATIYIDEAIETD